MLIQQKHDVVIIEKDKARIDELSREFDCGFLQGDGSRPKLLREAGPEDTDALLCLTDDDQDNKLDNTISADQVTARRLVDNIEGRGVVELSTVLRGDLRFYVISVGEEEAGPLSELTLPPDTRVLYGYHENELLLPEEAVRVEAGDDLVLLTTSERLKEMQERKDREDA